MIYTVTFNPSLDYIVDVSKFQEGVVNRTEHEKIFPGGKGINVSIVLKNLGIENTALGFTAGFIGNENGIYGVFWKRYTSLHNIFVQWSAGI